MGVRLLQMRPIQMGVHVFMALHVGTLQLQFIIESWDFLFGHVGYVLSRCAAV